jgi:hypothetical protein
MRTERMSIGFQQRSAQVSAFFSRFCPFSREHLDNVEQSADELLQNYFLFWN